MRLNVKVRGPVALGPRLVTWITFVGSPHGPYISPKSPFQRLSEYTRQPSPIFHVERFMHQLLSKQYICTYIQLPLSIYPIPHTYIHDRHACGDAAAFFASVGKGSTREPQCQPNPHEHSMQRGMWHLSKTNPPIHSLTSFCMIPGVCVRKTGGGPVN